MAPQMPHLWTHRRPPPFHSVTPCLLWLTPRAGPTLGTGPMAPLPSGPQGYGLHALPCLLWPTFGIPDLPLLATSLDTCALPPYPHCPGPLLDFTTPAVTRQQARQALTSANPCLGLLYQAVRSSGLPNYRGARQPVPNNINISAWRQRSRLFTDPSLIEMLEFGFPIGYTAPHPPGPYQGNHPSAT